MKLFCFLGASGSGKSTIQHALPLRFLTHYITRELRDGEVDGVHAIYTTHEEFKGLAEQNAFATITEYAGNFYGSPKWFIGCMASGQAFHATATIDSIRQFKEVLGEDKVVVIYIKPPERPAVLKNRMLARGDSLEQVNKRIANIYSTAEFENEKYADYIIINDNLDQAIQEVRDIVIDELDVAGGSNYEDSFRI